MVGLGWEQAWPGLGLLLKGNICWPNLLWDKGPRRRAGRWRGWSSALALQPMTQGQQEESSSRGAGAWRRGAPALWRRKDPGKHSGALDIFMAVKSVPGKPFFQSLPLQKCHFSPLTSRFLSKLVPFTSWKFVEEVLRYKILWCFKWISKPCSLMHARSDISSLESYLGCFSPSGVLYSCDLSLLLRRWDGQKWPWTCFVTSGREIPDPSQTISHILAKVLFTAD